MNAPLNHRGVIAVAKERPFDGRLHVMHVDVDKRLSITDVLASIPNLPDNFADLCEARVNGDLIPQEFWSRVYPKNNPFIDVAITFTIPLQNSGGGSGGGHKNLLVTVATIAVLLAATAASGGALAGLNLFLGAGALSAGSIGATIAGAAIGIGGSLAIAALTPPPTSTANTAASNETAAPIAASLTGNVLASGAAVPRVIGTMRVFPPLACQPLIEVIGDLEYAETVMVLAGPHALSSVRVGGIDAANVEELETELQEGLPSSPIQTLVLRYGATSTPNVELSGYITDEVTVTLLDSQSDPTSSCPQWLDFISKNSPDEIWINLSWPYGLFKTDATTDKVNQPVRVRFRRRGDVSWINCPEVHFSSNAAGPFTRVIRLKWGDRPIAPNLPPSNRGPVYAYKVVPVQGTVTGATPAIGGWTADSSFSSGSGNDLLSLATIATSKIINTELFQDKAIFYLDPDVFPQDAAYEIQVMRGSPYRSVAFTASAYVLDTGPDPDVYDLFQYYENNTDNFTTPVNQTLYNGRVVVPRISSVWNENPIQSNDFATVSVKVHSRSLEQVSVLASGYVADWDGSDWNTITTTSNPAPHFYDVLTGTLGAAPLPKAIVNSSELVAWRTACTANGYTCNAVVEGKSYQDVLGLIASSGYARLRHNETWGVFLDRDRSADTPIQVFTPRNMSGFSWTKAFAKRPSGLRAGFINSDLEYVDDEVIVYHDPANPDGTNLEQINYEGLVTIEDVEARAAFDLLQADLRLTFYSGQTDWESLVCTRGDLVAVQHDILAAQAGFARITGVTILAGNVTGLTLEGTVPVPTVDAWSSPASAWSSYSSAWSAAATGIAIRLKGGGGILTKQITAGSDPASVVTFSVPFADPGASLLDVDCLCAIGPLGSEYRRLIVYGISPDEKMGAQITFVDEAPELWAA